MYTNFARQGHIHLARRIGILCVYLLLGGIASAQRAVVDRPLMIVMTLNGNHYLTTTGGRTANGCEAWLTMLKSGETVYVARCSEAKLAELEMKIKPALSYNARLESRRRIVLSGDPMMIDFPEAKMQALVGIVIGGALVYLIMDAEENLTYYRAEGTTEQIKGLGFDISALLKANDTLDSRYKIQLSEGRINVAERIVDKRQMLIGKTADQKLCALVLDQKKVISEIVTE